HHGVADNDRLFRHDGAVARRLDDDLAAGKSLADIVVAFSLELEGDAMCEPRAKRLARGALQIDADRVMRQAGMAVDSGHFTGQHCASASVGVVDVGLDLDRRAAIKSRRSLLDELAVEHGLQMMVLQLRMIDSLTLLFLLTHAEF